MSQNKIIIITKNANDFISLKKNLSENGMETCTVSSIEKLFVKYISLPFVLAIIDASSYRDAVNWAATNGITTGYADGTFVPNAACTRANIMTFLYRYYNK